MEQLDERLAASVLECSAVHSRALATDYPAGLGTLNPKPQKDKTLHPSSGLGFRARFPQAVILLICRP